MEFADVWEPEIRLTTRGRGVEEKRVREVTTVGSSKEKFAGGGRGGYMGHGYKIRSPNLG